MTLNLWSYETAKMSEQKKWNSSGKIEDTAIEAEKWYAAFLSYSVCYQSRGSQSLYQT